MFRRSQKPPVMPDSRRRRLLLGSAAHIAVLALSGQVLGATAAPQQAARALRPIEIGLMPYMPTARLIAGHQPLRTFLEAAFKRPVVLSTAPDFFSFQQRVLNGDFDFMVIGPGPGWQAHLDRQHQVIAVSERKVRIYILVSKDGPIKSMADLRGKSLATIDPLTVTSQTTMAMLHSHKLNPGRDVQIRHEKTPFNCVQALAIGEVAAAGFPNVSFPNLPPEIRSKVDILHESDDIPGVLFTVRPAPDMPSSSDFQAALLQFAMTEAGRKFVTEFNHDSLALPDPKALGTLDRFVPETRRLMGIH